jgi:hypothetical protein
MAIKPKDISHAVFNNNPGNIKYSVGGKKLDYLKVLDKLGIKYSKGSEAADGGYFIKFESHADGYKAAKAWWPTVRSWAAYEGLTLNQALEKYSGEGYSAKKLGIDLDGSKLLSEFSDEELGDVMTSQIKMEDPKEYEILKNEGLLSEETQEEEFPGLLPEVEIVDDSKETSKKKYRKDVLDRISGRDEYLKYLEDNQDAFKELSIIEKNLKHLSKGTKEYNDLVERKNYLIKRLDNKENILKKDLYEKELNNYVNSENNSREEQSRLEKELKGYIDAKQEPPQDLINQIIKVKKEKEESGNRVKLLVNQDWRDYDISPVQQGYNQNILLPDGTIDIEKSITTPILPDPLSDDKEEDVVYNVVNENTDETQIIETTTDETTTDETTTDEVVTEESVTEEGSPLTGAQRFGQAGNALLKGAGAALDAIGGPGAIISYIMGKKGLKEAMKEVKPQASAELSPMFMQHLRQTRELAKKGFHPDQAQKFRKELDGAYQKGLENAVRGSGGQRARFLAQSGVLDAQRSSALLDYAVKDEELQEKNQEKYEKAMLFKENFDIQRTEKERAEDMERQVANKKAAAGFTAAAFTNLLSGFGRSSLVPNPAPGATQLYDSIKNWGKTEKTTQQ